MSQFGNIETLTREERAVVDWQYGFCGGFFEALFGAIAKADEQNLASIEKGFPDEVAGYKHYAYQDGWWPMVEKKMRSED